VLPKKTPAKQPSVANVTKYYGKTTRNAIRDLKAAGTSEMKEQLPSVAAMIDKLAKRGIIHKNKAANLKSKLAKKVNAAK